MDELSKDIRYGIRTLIKSPGFALVTILRLVALVRRETVIVSELPAQ